MLPHRRHEVSRLEAFSDAAAFAFALTLLVVSLDVPRSYGELVRTMRGFPSFALHWLFGSYAGRKRKEAVAAQR
jgi:uncharacterized membrane protein